MLQIIGWLGCAMLAVKLLEMGANPALKKEGGGMMQGVGFALLFGWCAVAACAVGLLVQGEKMSRVAEQTASTMQAY